MAMIVRLFASVAAILACTGAGSAADNICPAAQPQVQIAILNGYLEEFSDTTIADLARAAKRHNAPIRHPILGVYISTIGLRLDIKDRNIDLGAGRRCSVPEVIYVRLGLTGRAVHLPRDFTDSACLLDLARTHQKKHAAADDDLLKEIVSRFSEKLRTRMASLHVEPAPSDAAATMRMTDAAKRIVEEELDSYQQAKDGANKLVDSPEEVARIRSACDGALDK